jgi:hypothetical protein
MPVGVLAAGPGSPDFLPNSGDQSHPGGATYTIEAERNITCTGDNSFTGMSGFIDITATAGGDPVPAGSYLIVYLTPNGGSDASPIGNVENNQVKVDISGAVAGDKIAYNLVVSSPFTTSKGGVLGLIATPGTADDWAGGRTNSAGCQEIQGTPTPTPVPPTPTPTPVPPTPTPTPVPPTPTPTPVPPTPTPTPGGGEGGATPTPTPTPVPPTPTPTPQGQVSGATGTPAVTLPPTNTAAAAAVQQDSSDGWRIVLLGLAATLAVVLLLTPVRRSIRRR